MELPFNLSELQNTFDNFPKKNFDKNFKEKEKYKELIFQCGNSISNFKKLITYIIINSSLPVCKICNNTFIRFSFSYLCETCSKDCYHKYKYASIKKTCFKKYGVENAYQSKEVKDKIKQTNLEKYGVEHCMGSIEIKNRLKKTKLEKYGDENYNNRKKAKETTLKNYGVDNIFKLPSVIDKSKQGVKSLKCQEKKKQTNIKNYGVAYSFQSKEVKEKIVKSMLLNYGVEHAMSSREVKDKIKETCLEVYGVDHPFKSEEIKEKSKNTCINKYGVNFYSKSLEFKKRNKKFWDSLSLEDLEKKYAKYVLTCQKKYGVDNVSQFPLIAEKKLCNSKKKIHRYVLNGKEYKVQGYEPQALDYLLNAERIDSKDIAILSVEGKPSVKYYNYIKERQSVYLPDIFIKSQNRIIEVKSKYTYEKDLEINLFKQKACLEQGYGFNFYIFHNKQFNII